MWRRQDKIFGMKRAVAITFLVFLLFEVCYAAQKRPLAIDDYFRFQNISDLNLTPDGKWVAYVVSKIDQAKDHQDHNIFMVPTAGGNPIQVTFSGKDERPRWSPDNRYLAFLSERNKKPQVYLLNRLGGEAIQLTDISQGVYDFEWAPDSKKLLLILIDPDPTEKEGEDDKPTLPYVITRLCLNFDQFG